MPPQAKQAKEYRVYCDVEKYENELSDSPYCTNINKKHATYTDLVTELKGTYQTYAAAKKAAASVLKDEYGENMFVEYAEVDREYGRFEVKATTYKGEALAVYIVEHWAAPSTVATPLATLQTATATEPTATTATAATAAPESTNASAAKTSAKTTTSGDSLTVYHVVHESSGPGKATETEYKSAWYSYGDAVNAANELLPSVLCAKPDDYPTFEKTEQEKNPRVVIFVEDGEGELGRLLVNEMSVSGIPTALQVEAVVNASTKKADAPQSKTAVKRAPARGQGEANKKQKVADRGIL